MTTPTTETGIVERPWQPWERNYSGNRIGVQEQQGENENWMILHVESGGAKTTTSLRPSEAWDLALRLSPSLVGERLDLFAKMRKAQDALHQFTWADTVSPLLRKVADEWDCDSSQCEFASSDMGSLSCPCMEDERGCRAVEADELRQFADALEVAAAWNARAAIAAMPDSTQLLQTMAGALERIAQPVYVAEPARKADSAWRVALGERIEIARDALAQLRAQEQRS